MGDIQDLFDQSDSEYLALEDAVRETERGRWFLNEFAARNRRTETAALFASISQLERAISRSSTVLAQVQEKSSLAHLADDLEILVRSLSQSDNNDQDALADLGREMALNAYALAKEVDQARERLAALPASSRLESTVIDLEHHLDAIIDLMTQQNHLSRKTEALIQIMNHIRARLAHAQDRDHQPADQTDMGNYAPLLHDAPELAGLGQTRSQTIPA